jgi:hypothetical protein
MNDRPTPQESELAKQRIETIALASKTKRMYSVLFALGCVIAGASLVIVELPVLAFCLFVSAAIGVLVALDASGHVDEVQRRSKKTLFPRCSLQPPKDGAPAVQGRQSLES